MNLKKVSPKSKKPKYLCQVVKCTRKALPGRDICAAHEKKRLSDQDPHEITVQQAEALLDDVAKIVDIVGEGANLMHDMCLLLYRVNNNKPVNRALMYRVYFDAQRWAENVENDAERLLEFFRKTIRGVVDYNGRFKIKENNFKRVASLARGGADDDCGAGNED